MIKISQSSPYSLSIHYYDQKLGAPTPDTTRELEGIAPILTYPISLEEAERISALEAGEFLDLNEEIFYYPHKVSCNQIALIKLQDGDSTLMTFFVIGTKRAPDIQTYLPNRPRPVWKSDREWAPDANWETVKGIFEMSADDEGTSKHYIKKVIVGPEDKFVRNIDGFRVIDQKTDASLRADLTAPAPK